MDWFPHRVQFELKYWQETLTSKKLIEGNIILQDFAPLHDYYSTEATTGAWRVGSYADDPFKVTTVETLHGLRGHQYDLRITFIPVDWMDVLNKFKLNTLTYVIFYFVIDAAMVILIM